MGKKFDMEEALHLYPPGRKSPIENKKIPEKHNQVDMASLLQEYTPSTEDLQAKVDDSKSPRNDYRTELKCGRIDEEIDLHSLYQAEARLKLGEFFDRAQRNGLRKIRIIHGKGHHSAEGKGVLQQLVRNFLQEAKNAGLVLDFYHPPEREGGKGATVALISRKK